MTHDPFTLRERASQYRRQAKTATDWRTSNDYVKWRTISMKKLANLKTVARLRELVHVFEMEMGDRQHAKAWPHKQVYVRLGKSDIHGIGVFACRLIPQGTNIFANDERELLWVPDSVLSDPTLSGLERSFYQDFAIRRGNELGCPSNFNLLTVGWYVNEPEAGEEPNVTSTDLFDLIALRDIEAGEELTLSYSSFASSV